MKYSQWIGIVAAALLVAACFMPWAWYPDLQMHFTGFFSHQNYYGKPGKMFSLLAIVAIGLFLVPKLWAKRLNLLVNSIVMAYAIYCFLIFSRCYGPAICPEKRLGLFLVPLSALLMLIMALLPDIPINPDKKKDPPNA